MIIVIFCAQRRTTHYILNLFCVISTQRVLCNNLLCNASVLLGDGRKPTGRTPPDLPDNRPGPSRAPPPGHNNMPHFELLGLTLRSNTIRPINILYGGTNESAVASAAFENLSRYRLIPLRGHHNILLHKESGTICISEAFSALLQAYLPHHQFNRVMPVTYLLGCSRTSPMSRFVLWYTRHCQSLSEIRVSNTNVSTRNLFIRSSTIRLTVHTNFAFADRMAQQPTRFLTLTVIAFAFVLHHENANSLVRSSPSVQAPEEDDSDDDDDESIKKVRRW